MPNDLLSKKRRLDTPKARTQQRARLRKTLFKKCHHYSMECDADVYMVLRLKGSGRIFTFQSDSTGGFSPSLRDLVRTPSQPESCYCKILSAAGVPLAETVEDDLKGL